MEQMNGTNVTAAAFVNEQPATPPLPSIPPPPLPVFTDSPPHSRPTSASRRRHREHEQELDYNGDEFQQQQYRRSTGGRQVNK
jgi:hypothetical protein